MHRAGDGGCRLDDLGVGGEAGAAVGEEGCRVEQGLAAGLRAALKEEAKIVVLQKGSSINDVTQF